MSSSFQYTFDTPVYKGNSTIHTGLFIGGEWLQPIEGCKIDVINPCTGKVITSIAAGTHQDVDLAVAAARKAFKTSWGPRTPGDVRAKMLHKLADLVEQNGAELAALESLNTGKPFPVTQMLDIPQTLNCLRYYAGWADKVQGKTIETHAGKVAYTRHEPVGVVAGIVPWNFPILMLVSKIAPALATGNAVIVKPSEVTPLTALKLADLINEAGFPPGVLNIVNGYGQTVGQSLAEHLDIDTISFTGSTLTGRKIQEASARSNLKSTILELGGKSPNIIFDDANLEQAVKWASMGIFFNSGQVCTAGSRIFVQEGIYDRFLAAFTQAAQALQSATGDPFAGTSQHGPQVSQTQFDRVMGYIDSGKKDGATVHTGGQQEGEKGFFIEPTIFTNVDASMKIVKEEIFGPVAAIMKFKTEEEVIEKANDTVYGLAAAVFTESIGTAIRVTNALDAGTTWVNCYNDIDFRVPFGGFKQSGNGADLGEHALANYTRVKAVHINIGVKI
ncbi:aldehyde dehydrogenase [Mycena floridula]|nr:aldehyde dehydrogenase [Mycena floridula]